MSAESPYRIDPNGEWHHAVRIDATDPLIPDETRARVWVSGDEGIEFALGHEGGRRFLYAASLVSPVGELHFDDAMRLAWVDRQAGTDEPILIEGRDFRMNVTLPMLGRQTFRNLEMMSNLLPLQFARRAA